MSSNIFKKLAYIFLFSVILFGIWQYSKYQETINLIIEDADLKDVKRQAVIDAN